ncbi:GNAT family N-acetyltransferase [Thalassomonas viridans]|uniref:GNAT family N-acetyltransferase n=1 Tax=Thalassomonas viridans TaxID=137584 RepID=A0AAE9Z065_9GAMM|nr:GNAT family N-acetyltransferase [Thalassomonas viridans]WDE02777.1 GNAT family N-acetyltransferase [Thalassomonas viridans]
MTTFDEIKINPLTPKQWPEFMRIRLYPDQQRFVPTPEKIRGQFIFERTDKKAPFEIFVIELDNQVAGFFTLVKDVDDYLWFGGFQIDIAFQNAGIGRAVFERLFAFVAKSPEYAGISLNVQYSNKTVIRFYQRMGLSQVAMMKPADEALWLMKISRENILQMVKKSA